MSPVTLLIGIVSYHSGEILFRCLDSIFSGGCRVDLEVCVVDNAPQSGDGCAARSRFPCIRAIDSPQNVGFGSGMNRAFRSSPSRYFLILNPDTEVQAGALDTLVDFLETHPSAGAVGPQLHNTDGRLQPSARRFPTPALDLLEALDLNLKFPNNRLFKRHTYESWNHDEMRSVDWLTGAALMVRSDLFTRIEGFDERFFMYSEEVDLCRRIRKAGHDVVFLPDARMLHMRAHSTRRTDLRQVEFYKSLHRYCRKHHGRFPALGIRLAIFLRQVVYIAAVGIRYLPKMQWDQFKSRLLPSGKLIRWALTPNRPR